jgi:hypothetical protein
MTDLRAAAQQALEALEYLNVTAEHRVDDRIADAAITALRAALEQQEQADYPEEKLQAVAEYVSNQYHVWYGVAARDIEEVLRQSVRCGLVSNPPRREPEPVTWGVDWGRDGDQSCCTIIKRHADGTQEVVAVEYGPPRREWVSLTEEDIALIDWESMKTKRDAARAIERALRSRNNG